MGYDIHITRADEWFDSEARPIAKEEWLALIEADPELQPAQPNADGSSLGYEMPGVAMWTAWSRAAAEDLPWIAYYEGRLMTKNPDREILRKLHQIAQALDAKVQGDEGEQYDADGEPIAIEGDEPPARRPWWKRLFGN